MIFNLYKLINSRSMGVVVLCIFIIHYSVSWLCMYMLEGSSSDIVQNFFYWYIVTVSTIGYGDILPQSFYGRIFVAVWMASLGIAIMAIIIGVITNVIVDFKNKIETGRMKMDLENHLIIVCDNIDKAKSTIDNFLADNPDFEILLFSQKIEKIERDGFHFCSGSLDNPADLNNACFNKAFKILVIPENDIECAGQLSLIVDATKDAAREIGIAAHVENKKTAFIIQSQTPDRVSVIADIMPNIMVQEVLDPGSFAFLTMITDNRSGPNINTLISPETGTVARLETVLNTKIIGAINDDNQPQLVTHNCQILKDTMLITLGVR